MGIYSQLDMLCSIGKFQSATESAATRKITFVLLTFFGIAIIIVFGLVALMFPFNALPPPTFAEMLTAGMTGYFLALCGYYVRSYGKFCENDPWKKLKISLMKMLTKKPTNGHHNQLQITYKEMLRMTS